MTNHMANTAIQGSNKYTRKEKKNPRKLSRFFKFKFKLNKILTDLH